MKKLLLTLCLLLATTAQTDTKISQLPLGNASTTGPNDSFPYVNAAAGTTQRLDLSDLLNLPSLGVMVRTDRANTYTSGPQSFGTQVLTIQITNDTSTGTVTNKLAKLTSIGRAVITGTSDVGGIVGVVAAGAGLTGSADVAQLGQVPCVFDNATTAGDFVVNSVITNGDCHDFGSTEPGSTQTVGRVLTTNLSAGTYSVLMFMPSVAGGGGGGSVSSVSATVPSWLTVSGVPITGSGTIAITGTSEAQNLVLASPNGSSGAMTPRALVAADVPSLSYLPLSGGTLSGNLNMGVGDWINAWRVLATEVSGGVTETSEMANGAFSVIANDGLGHNPASAFYSVVPGSADLVNDGSVLYSSDGANAADLAIAGANVHIGITAGSSLDLDTFDYGAYTLTNFAQISKSSSDTLMKAITGNLKLDAVTQVSLLKPIDMGSHQIHSVTDPTSLQDAATKNYVDNHGITALTGDVVATGPGSASSTIQANVVSNSKLAQMPAHTYKGNNTGSTANAADITSTQLTADLNLFSATLQGLVPSSGGGTTNFLRADGTWAAVASPLTFSDSLVNTGGNVTLVGDSATPGASKYYGTNGSSTLGYFALPTGFTNPMSTLGDLMYEDATPAAARLSGNTTTTKKYLSQTGTGTVSAAPAWSQPAFSELSGQADLTTQVSGQLPIANGGTGTNMSLQGGPHQVVQQSSIGAGFTSARLAPGDLSGSTTAGNVMRDTGSSWSSDAPDTVNFLTNFGAELTTPLPSAFADGGTTTPVNLTGGSPNTTCTRTTSSPLDGVASFLMTVNSGANRQGEGCAWTLTVPTGYQVANGLSVNVVFPFQTTGTVLSTDYQVWAYDVTNSKLIYPTWVSPIVGASGIAITQFPIQSNTASIRVAVYVARTSTGANTVTYDDVRIQPIVSSQVTGVQASDPTAYTPTLGGTTTSGTPVYMHQRVGPSDHIWGTFTVASSSATGFSISLPPGENIDSTKFGGGQTDVFGYLERATSAANAFAGNAVGPWPIVGSLGVTTSSVFVSIQAQSNVFGAANASSMLAVGDVVHFDFTVPIVGWSSQQNIVTAQSYWISNYLASGTRVTGSAPTQLGQYRSYLKNAGSRTYTETNGAPTTAPTAPDGVFIWGGPQYSSADPNNNPSRYDIFIGKNKSYVVQAFSSTGKSGALDIKLMPGWAGADDVGLETAYDPAIGVLTVLCPRQGNVGITGAIGLDNNGVAVNNGYFDVLVSPLAVAVGLISPTQQIFTSGSGTYITPTNPRPLYLKVTVSGGGGGGGGGNGGGTNGSASTFGTSLLTANGGTTGGSSTGPGAGGSVTIASPAIQLKAVTGGAGGSNMNNNTGSAGGGGGGVNSLGGSGAGGTFSGGAGASAASNSGAGGGGGGTSALATTVNGGGGGAGGYIEAQINNPAASYSYSVGSGGSGAAATGATGAGGSGGSGIVTVQEFYQ